MIQTVVSHFYFCVSVLLSTGKVKQENTMLHKESVELEEQEKRLKEELQRMTSVPLRRIIDSSL
jgi:hypothetical protein